MRRVARTAAAHIRSSVTRCIRKPNWAALGHMLTSYGEYHARERILPMGSALFGILLMMKSKRVVDSARWRSSSDQSVSSRTNLTWIWQLNTRSCGEFRRKCDPGTLKAKVLLPTFARCRSSTGRCHCSANHSKPPLFATPCWWNTYDDPCRTLCADTLRFENAAALTVTTTAPFGVIHFFELKMAPELQNCPFYRQSCECQFSQQKRQTGPRSKSHPRCAVPPISTVVSVRRSSP